MPEKPQLANFARLLEVLHAADVELIVIGGMAMISHGSARFTWALDILYRRTSENHARIVSALKPLRPRLRGRDLPDDLPFLFDEQTLKAGLNFTFKTEEGPIDILGEVSGVGRYEDALPTAVEYELYGRPTKVLSLELLLEAKKAAARKKDLAAIDEIQELIQLRDRERGELSS